MAKKTVKKKPVKEVTAKVSQPAKQQAEWLTLSLVGVIVALVLGIGVATVTGCPGCKFDPVTPVVVVPEVPKATAVTYVYEKDDTAIPAGVKVAIDRLNREGNVVASMFEHDATDGTDEVPEQFKVALTAAKVAGLPAVVATAGQVVVKVVKAPQGEAETMAVAQ